MLEGLEISEALFSETIKNKDFRIDSQYYTQAPIKNPILKYKKIGEVIHSSQYGISIEMNEDGHGYPIYRMNELHNMLCDLEVNKYADITHDEYQRFALKDRDVLFNRTNSFEWVGRTGVYYQNDNVERTFASYLVRFNPIEKDILPEYLCAFLNSKEGVRDIKRRARQSINQTNVNPEEVKEIEIPVLDMDFQLQIKEHFEKANLCRLQSLSLYKDAENQLLDELGLKGWQPNNEPINIKQLKESFLASGRLDAEYYQLKYDEIESVVTKYRNGSDLIRNLFSQNTEVCDFNEEAYNYIEIGDINIGNGTANYNLIQRDELPDNAKRVLHKNDILISKVRPYRGAVSIIDFDDTKLIGSGAFTVLHEKTAYKKEVLQILLRSQVYKEWLLKWNVGSSYPVIKDEDILNLPVPLVPQHIQKEIAEYVQKSISLRNEAKQLLESAKLKVEDAISTPPI